MFQKWRVFTIQSNKKPLGQTVINLWHWCDNQCNSTTCMMFPFWLLFPNSCVYYLVMWLHIEYWCSITLSS